MTRGYLFALVFAEPDLSDLQIRALQAAALTAGDAVIETICSKALDGIEGARALVQCFVREKLEQMG